LSKVSARTAAAAKAKVDMSEVEKKKAALAKLFPDTDIRIGSDETLDIPRISTGSIVVDSIIGGGLPAGRITEIFGPYSSGKTTFALTSIANVQKQGGSALFIDLESSLDPRWAKRLGVDLESLIVVSPDLGSEALDLLSKAVAMKAFDIIVFDSIGGLVADGVYTDGTDHSGMGEVARMLSSVVPTIAQKAKKTQTTVVFINQLRANLTGYGASETTRGGKAVPYAASLRLRVSRQGKKGQIVEDGKTVGVTLSIKVEKNKTAAPDREAETVVNFRRGLDPAVEAFGVGVQLGIIEAATIKTYKFRGKDVTTQGRKAAIATIRETPALYEAIYQEIVKKLEEALDDGYDAEDLDNEEKEVAEPEES